MGFFGLVSAAQQKVRAYQFRRESQRASSLESKAAHAAKLEKLQKIQVDSLAAIERQRAVSQNVRELRMAPLRRSLASVKASLDQAGSSGARGIGGTTGTKNNLFEVPGVSFGPEQKEPPTKKPPQRRIIIEG